MHYFFDGTQELLETMIAQAVREALRPTLPQKCVEKNATQPSPKVLLPAPILVAVYGYSCLRPFITEPLKTIEHQDIRVRIERADTWDNATDLSKMILSPYVVLFPAFNENTIAKAANGIFDEPLSRLLIKALKYKKIIYAVAPQPSATLRQNSPVLFRQTQAHQQKLSQFGVRWIEHKNIAKVLLAALPKSTFTETTLNTISSTLVTAADIEKIARNNQQKLQIPYRTIITPLAKDRARELGIIFERSG